MSIDTYLQRYAYPKSWIGTNPNLKTGIIVVIPAYNEQSLIPTLESLHNCEKPNSGVEVIIVVNEPENAKPEIISRNRISYKEAQIWIKSHNTEDLNFHLILAENLPPNDHGVGLARKIGMDEALRRFNSIKNVKHGIIACFDADSISNSNYLRAIEEHFQVNNICPAVSIYFEHKLNEIKNPRLLSGIIQYELHLRYFIHAQRLAGFPHSFHAVGSSMAVNADAYQKQGGMNKRKAGEDFYFLHKMVTLGDVMELNSTVVYPSARSSDRVPFGTGRAIKDWMSSNQNTYLTYNPESFIAAQDLFKELHNIYNGRNTEKPFPECLQNFLDKESFEKHLEDIKSKTSDYRSFQKRFYSWFNGFKVIKYVHYCRDNYYNNINVEEASRWLLENFHGLNLATTDPLSLLEIYRELDRQS
jgi:hypothetical protein